MSDSSSRDRWAAGDSCKACMGRWSWQIAQRFVDWIAVPARAWAARAQV